MSRNSHTLDCHCTTCINQWIKDYANLEAENKKLQGLVKAAICPNVMNGCKDGVMPNPYGDIEQCQWCDEREQALKGE